ncbi:MarR family winged helix-turn-helix transcriptional regulator [Arenivirga flava]|uniref:MarR family transcriptional regulator n=1 Tax=Arenivirga flava TaxID=1930060 RepID=A0AA37USL0_9MICO|nr:MarR family winged helix-turn-helix transcriptional regulator [Arenivirga flava]GMA29496.1 MarR family transcriptional regulator [Arenivirga flava]
MPVTDDMVCFSLYAATRATTQAYRALLEPWGLTYPQYLVLAVLWNDGDQSVKTLGERLQLDSGTLSPLLRRMDEAGLVTRARRADDERVVTVALGDLGRDLRGELAHIPARIAAGTGLDGPEAAESLIRTLQELTRTMQATAAAATAQPTREGAAAT